MSEEKIASSVQEATLAMPVGRVRPSFERAVKALKAIEERRYRDARAHVGAMTDCPSEEAGWKEYLACLLDLGELDSADVETRLRRAASSALAVGMRGETGTVVGILRLAAACLEELGRFLRRGERFSEAVRAHRAAWLLRVEFGSVEEQWESASGIGLGYGLGRRVDRAELWHCMAAELARRATEGSARKEAVSLQHLCGVLLDAQSEAEAVEAARKACEAWRRDGSGGVDLPRAEFRCAKAVLSLAEACAGSDPRRARELLGEASDRLRRAREELLPFGAPCEGDVGLCGEGLEFIDRLRASLS